MKKKNRKPRKLKPPTGKKKRFKFTLYGQDVKLYYEIAKSLGSPESGNLAKSVLQQWMYEALGKAQEIAKQQQEAKDVEENTKEPKGKEPNESKDVSTENSSNEESSPSSGENSGVAEEQQGS